MKRTEAFQVAIALVLVLGTTLACKRRKPTESTPVPVATTAATDDDDDDDDPVPSAPTATAATAEPTATTAPAAAKSVFHTGDKVTVLWKGEKYPAKVIAVVGNDKYKIHYVDYDASWDEVVGLDRIVGAKTGAAVAATVTPKATGAGGGAKVTTGGGTPADAPCPGPGLTRRCSGVCVNLQTDDHNCGSCGTVCPAGKHCDGHLFCRDAQGNL